MANTYTQIQLHFVFAVKYRQAMLNDSWKSSLQKYMTGIVTRQGHKLLAINNVPDHMHLLIGLRPVQSISDLMEKVKGDSSAWINDNQLTKAHFNWQAGYSCFSISKEDVLSTINYILNQEDHHRTKTFREEYLKLLKEHNIEFEEKYLFKNLE